MGISANLAENAQALINISTTPLGSRNRIINGACNIAQRPALAYTYGVYGYGGPDRYFAENYSTAANGQFTQSQGTITYGGVVYNAVMQTVNTAIVTDATTNYWTGITQRIEGLNCYDLLGHPVAVSFIFETNVSGMYSVALTDGGQLNSWVTTISAVAGTPLKVVIPISMLPSTLSIPNTTSVGLYLYVGALNTGTYQTSTLGTWQTGNYFAASGAMNWGTTVGNYIAATQIQLEQGTTATPFEKRSIGQELILCQRYYLYLLNLLTSGYNGAGYYVYGDFTYPAAMRAIPTVTFSVTSSYNASGLATNEVQQTHVVLEAMITAAGSGYIEATTMLSAEL